jgi:hypothetical protein
VPETPEEFHARVAGALRMPPVETWDSFPFEGEMRPRALQPPPTAEEPRRGEAGVDCRECERPDAEFVWTNERYGDGSAHRHWWFMARPARTPQLASSFAAIWDDVLPPTPEDVWYANLDAVVVTLEAGA